jgi:ABC-type sugar transport system ATPase subunit
MMPESTPAALSLAMQARDGQVGAQAPAASFIELRAISKYYGHVRALEGVDFSLLPGEIHALVGDNGAGKSTLIKIISGAIAPSSGAIYVGGARVSFTQPDDAFAAGIATLYQDLALVSCRSIAENLFLGREPTRWGFVRRGQMEREANTVLASFKQMNITDIEARVSDLSGGQRQAVAIGRAVHEGSRILLLDEPTAALGIRESQHILDLLEHLKGPARSILIVSHNLSHVFRIADRITVLRGGALVGTVAKSDATPDDIVKMITGAAVL